MRVLYFLLILLLAAAGALAQIPAKPVEIIENQWNMRVYIPALYEPPSSAGNYDRDEELRVMRETLRQERIRSQTGLSTESRQVEINEEEFKPKPNEPIAVYTYRVKVKNNASKTISKISWDYVFFAPETNKEVGRRRFDNKVKIEPGKNGKLEMQSRVPPTGTINAKNADRKTRPKYNEKIIIRSIEYADGTRWKLFL